MPILRRPKGVLFDLFHTLASVPPPSLASDIPVPQILGVDAEEWQRLFYREDRLGRCLGRVDDLAAMRSAAHAIDSRITEDRIIAATESRRLCFAAAIIEVERDIVNALHRLRAAGIRTALVSDAGAHDVANWEDSPLSTCFDATVFSFQVGVRKPAPRIYQHALDAIGVAAGDVIFVGDGDSNEHHGAKAVGLTTVLVTRLAAQWWPELIEARRTQVDCTFDDVVALVDALGL